MFDRRLAALLASFILLAAACSAAPGGSPSGSAAGSAAGSESASAPASEEPSSEAPSESAGGESPAGDLLVGVSWNNYNEERWAKSDEPAIKAALEEAGASYTSTDAGSSAEQQLADVENLLSQGVDALIILAQDGEAILPAVESAIDQGVPVIAYDRLIENPDTLYITFDNIGVGKLQAEVIFGLVPEGRYAIIKGNQADANADFLREGYEQVIGDAVSSGAIEIACETYTDNWLPDVAQTNMEQCLTQEDNDIDAVLSENDGMAGGVVAALEAQGLQVPVSGQDGDKAALNRVALGTQSVSVWKDARELGKAAGEAAVQLAQGAALADVEGVQEFESPGGNTMTSILLTPIAITQDNLDVVIDADWITQEELCQGVDPGSVDACP
jgi:D-xylose transport system substrate-binding protein